MSHRHSADYVARTIRTVRQHNDQDSWWTNAGNVLADEVEDTRADHRDDHHRATKYERALRLIAETDPKDMAEGEPQEIARDALR